MSLLGTSPAQAGPAADDVANPTVGVPPAGGHGRSAPPMRAGRQDG